MTNEQLDNIKTAFPDGIVYKEYTVENEQRVRIYRKGSFLATWQIDLSAEQENTCRLKAICDAINHAVDAYNEAWRIIRKVEAAEKRQKKAAANAVGGAR